MGYSCNGTSQIARTSPPRASSNTFREMKMVARSYVWWTKLDKDIEQLVKSCRHCQAVQNVPPVAPLHPWIWPAEPWKRIHIDFVGPFCGRTFLVIVDSYSKWPEIIQMKSTTTAATVIHLRKLFSAYGLPEQLFPIMGHNSHPLNLQNF